MAEVVLSREALANLDLIIAYIKQFDPAAAQKFAVALIEAAKCLETFPARGRPASNGARELPIVPPYVIRYDLEGDRVTILGIRHGRQNG